MVGGATVHLLALPQTLLIAQAALGLLLLSGDYRAPDKLHYVYGGGRARRRPLAVVLRAGRPAPAPALVRRLGTRRRRARGAWHHDGVVRRFYENRTVRGLAIVALIALVVVVLSLEPVLAAIGGLLGIAFFLAVAFFLFLVWRERRGDLEAWSDRSRRVFYGAIALAVVDIGAAIGLSPMGADAIAFFAVLALLRVGGRPHLAGRAPLLLTRPSQPA